jgi:hypothetical protein
VIAPAQTAHAEPLPEHANVRADAVAGRRPLRRDCRTASRSTTSSITELE